MAVTAVKFLLQRLQEPDRSDQNGTGFLQMQNLQEDMTILKNESGHVDVIKNENLNLVQKLESLQVTML